MLLMTMSEHTWMNTFSSGSDWDAFEEAKSVGS